MAVPQLNITIQVSLVPSNKDCRVLPVACFGFPALSYLQAIVPVIKRGSSLILQLKMFKALSQGFGQVG